MSGNRRKRSGIAPTALAALFVALLDSDSWSSQFGSDAGEGPDRAEFYFVRLAYTVYPGMGGYARSERWLTDWPEAEQFLMSGVRRLTRIKAAQRGVGNLCPRHAQGISGPADRGHPAR